MNITKRRFLTAIAGGALAAGAWYGIGSVARAAAGKSVLVIGAGAAGIKAAQDLTRAGFSVTVLEGRGRIGGRTHSDTSLGVPLDLGASWIHGIKGNPLYAYARQMKMPTFKWDYDDIKFTGLEGMGKLSLWWHTQKAENNLYKYGERILNQNPDATVQDIVDAVHRGERLSKAEKSAMDFYVALNIEQSMAADLDALGIAGLLEGEDFRGEDVLLPGGYGTLVTSMANGLDIRTSHIVHEIDHGGRHVRVDTSKGSFTADHVVITVPLGVLKAGGIRFSPALSAAKARALDGMRMGVMNKLYLEFPRTFWDDDKQNYVRLAEGRSDWSFFTNLRQVSGKPVLCAFNTGRVASRLEGLTDDEQVAEAMEVLRTMFNSRVPDPIGVIATRWQQDAFALGSYSHLGVGAQPSLRQDLAAPVGGKLFFAGEATHADFPATVQGAYYSGERAAREVAVMAHQA